MCEYGTDKPTCPDCPETCQGDKRDYAATAVITTAGGSIGSLPCGDYIALPAEELNGIRTENAQLRTQLAESQAREGAMRDALALANSMIRSEESMSTQAEGIITKALPSPAPVNLEAMRRVCEAAKIYHKQENPNRGKLMVIGKCKSCGCEIPSISDDYCEVCVWDILHEALAYMEGGGVE